MPIYEYQCDNCGHRLENLQRLSDDPLRDCRACGKPALNKVVSAAAFRLKGDGWYETDFKTGHKKNALHTDDSASKTASDSPTSSTTNTSKSDTGSGKTGAATKTDADSSST